MNFRRKIKQIITIVCLLCAAALIFPMAAQAEETGKTVRVGWHEEPYFITDQYGRRSGYTYDYQQKLVAYTGWNLIPISE